MKERRKHQRQKPKKYPTVYNFYTGKPIGLLANLSSAGGMIITPGPIKTSTTFRCRVELAGKVLGRNEIVFDAECRWCRKNVKAGRWESGYRLKMTGIDAELVSYLTHSLEMDDIGDRNFGEVATIDLENRRKSTRYDIDTFLPVYEQHSYRQIGRLADLSTRGVRLITQKPVEKNDLLHCRIVLPTKVFQQEYLIFNARCMWCRRSKDGASYESGYEIENVSEQDASIILHLLIHFTKIQQTKKRIQVVG